MTLTIAQDVDVSKSTASEATNSTLPAAEPNRPNLRVLRKTALSAIVWMIYVPYLAILRLLGPRLGLASARGVARLHWLLASFGAQRAVRRALEEAQPHFRTSLPVSAILRSHLELKHECFVRTKLFNHASGGNDAELVWDIDPELVNKFNRLKATGKGLIIVGYHFGFFRLSATSLSRILPGCDAVHVSHRVAHYASDTFETVAQLALEKAYAADLQSGVRIHYINHQSSMLRICRTLLAGETIALAADGSFAKDFLDVPFLDAKIRLPCGWARLAAATHSNVLILLDTEIGQNRRRVWLFDHVQVRDDSAEEIYGAVVEGARLLDEFVRREPWAWHPWCRLMHETTADGVVRYLAVGGSSSSRCGPGQPKLSSTTAASPQIPRRPK